MQIVFSFSAAWLSVLSSVGGADWVVSNQVCMDFDGDGWPNAFELIIGTDVWDLTDPWDSDGDCLPDYLEFREGTDPLDAEDPPPSSFSKSAVSYLSSAPDVQESEEGKNYLPAFSCIPANWLSNFEAWNGEGISYGMASSSGAWSAVNGTKIEVWQNGYFELEGDSSNYGVQCSLAEVGLKSGIYVLEWRDQARWANSNGVDPGNAYSVEVCSGSETLLASTSFEPSAGSSHNRTLFFTVSENHISEGIKLIFRPQDNNTSGVLIENSSLFLKRVFIEVVQTNDPQGNVGASEDCSSYSERIIEPLCDDQELTSTSIAWITAEPMPPTLNAKVVNLPLSVVVNWSCDVESEREERRAILDSVTEVSVDYRGFGATETRGDEVLSVSGALDNECVGGSVTLRVCLFQSGQEITNAVLPDFRFVIRGKNPMDSIAKEYINSEMGADFPYAWAVGLHETMYDGTVYNQFNSAPEELVGTPNKGNPNGWGIGQIDNYGESSFASTADLYDWKFNVRTMRSVLAEKRATFERIKENVKSYIEREYSEGRSREKWVDLPESYLHSEGNRISVEFLSTIIYYNGADGCKNYNGSLFPWELVDGTWRFVDNNNGYGQAVMDVYFNCADVRYEE